MSNAIVFTTDPSELDFDVEALRDKYRSERDKRIRKDTTAQYQEPVGDFSKYVDDPYVEPGFKREPLFDEVEVVVIGGGFGGLLAGARLREAGFEDIRMIDRAGDFGGTWYWNRYPGAQCDVESYVYLPLLEEVGYIPKEKYSYAPEIFEHSKAIARHYKLYENACLQTQVKQMTWDEASARWTIETDRGDRMKARFVAMSNGPLSRPKLPGISGISKFRGHTFHTSRWDYEYTGGDASGNLDKLKDKRVGIIGTGATAVQCIPHLGASAGQLYVFQRTPSSIDVRNNRSTDPEWSKTLNPGWQQERMDNFNTLTSGGRVDEDMVQDGWTDIFRNLTGAAARENLPKMSAADISLVNELADFQKMNQIRARVDTIVEEPETAAALKPWYRQFCKRPGFHDEYLQTYNLPNVKLVDTRGQGVERITENAVVVDGVEYEVDCLIFATGFEVGTNYTSQCGYDLVGREGVRLSEKWAEGLRTYHGLHSHNYPNCFFMGFTQSGFTTSVPHTLNEQSRHIAYILRHVVDNEISSFEATQEAEDEWVGIIKSKAHLGARFYAECTPGYYNNEGVGSNDTGFLSGQYGDGPVAFFKLLDKWRADGKLEGLDMK